jgi:hypothetical protein
MSAIDINPVGYGGDDFPCPTRHIFYEVNACISEFDKDTRRQIQVASLFLGCPWIYVKFLNLLVDRTSSGAVEGEYHLLYVILAHISLSDGIRLNSFIYSRVAYKCNIIGCEGRNFPGCSKII